MNTETTPQIFMGGCGNLSKTSSLLRKIIERAKNEK